jgi:cation transport protein ChaC
LPTDALDRVWQREMSGRLVYDARLLRVMTANDTRQVLAFTALRGCADYAGRLSLDEAARLILGAAGRRGTCRDYFENTMRHLEQLGLADRPLRGLAERVRAIAMHDGI